MQTLLSGSSRRSVLKYLYMPFFGKCLTSNRPQAWTVRRLLLSEGTFSTTCQLQGKLCKPARRSAGEISTKGSFASPPGPNVEKIERRQLRVHFWTGTQARASILKRSAVSQQPAIQKDSVNCNSNILLLRNHHVTQMQL